MYMRHQKVVKLLLLKGANPNSTDEPVSGAVTLMSSLHRLPTVSASEQLHMCAFNICFRLFNMLCSNNWLAAGDLHETRALYFCMVCMPYLSECVLVQQVYRCIAVHIAGVA